jgi:hypothetical protein
LGRSVPEFGALTAVTVVPAQAGTQVCRGYRPSPVWQRKAGLAFAPFLFFDGLFFHFVELVEADQGLDIDALLYLLVSFHYAKQALTELKEKGEYSGLTPDACVTARHDIETLVGFDQFYEVEEETVEEKKWGKR